MSLFHPSSPSITSHHKHRARHVLSEGNLLYKRLEIYSVKKDRIHLTTFAGRLSAEADAPPAIQI
jgi:hypothetical protein